LLKLPVGLHNATGESLFFPLQAGHREGLLNGIEHLFGVKRLHNVVVNPKPEHFYRHLF